MRAYAGVVQCKIEGASSGLCFAQLSFFSLSRGHLRCRLWELREEREYLIEFPESKINKKPHIQIEILQGWADLTLLVSLLTQAREHTTGGVTTGGVCYGTTIRIEDTPTLGTSAHGMNIWEEDSPSPFQTIQQYGSAFKVCSPIYQRFYSCPYSVLVTVEVEASVDTDLSPNCWIVCLEQYAYENIATALWSLGTDYYWDHIWIVQRAT